MNNRILLIALASLLTYGAPASAATKVVEAKDNEGNVVQLYDIAGPCVGNARAAAYIDKHGSRVAGCWIPVQRQVQIAFLDGETLVVDASHFTAARDL